MSSQVTPERNAMLTGGKRSQFSMSRLEGLTDGIYAIAMTLLVLSLPLPELGHRSTESDISGHLAEYVHLFGTYALSFILLGNFWVVQQKIFRYIKSSSITHLWTNLGGLLVVCLIPFSSSLMGYHNHTVTANLVFHLNIFLISLFFLLQCRVLLVNPETIADGFDEFAIRRIIRINTILPLVSLAGAGIAFFFPSWSPLVYIAAPLLTVQLRDRLPVFKASD